MELDDIFLEIGGLSTFQILMIIGVYGMKISTAWSMIQISFDGLVPNFICETNSSLHDVTSSINNTKMVISSWDYKKLATNVCYLNGTKCHSYTFLGETRSIVSQWSLVCDMKYTKTTIASIQMAGVLLGAMLAGHSGDHFGRKITTYTFFLLLLSFNAIIIFSNSWQMFAALRFLIGMAIGAILVMTVPYCSEYLPPKWRSLIPIVPMWPIGTGIFAGFAYLIQDWQYLLMANVCLSAPFLLGYIYFPESIRWLSVKGQLSAAYKVVEKIAIRNGRSVPQETMDVLQNIATKEKDRIHSGKKYTYLDLFNNRTVAFTSIILGFHWIVLSMVFYGLSFSASSFTGNIYLNIFIIGIIDIPGNLTVYYWSNRFGRKKSSIAFMLISSIASFSCLGVVLAAPEDVKGSLIRGLSLCAKIGIAASWVSVQTWVGELYPTVTRSLGYGFVNTASRIGGMLAPFAINLDNWIVFSFALMGGLSLLAGVLLGFISETVNQNLKDSVVTRSSLSVETPSQKVDIFSISKALENDKNPNFTPDITLVDDKRPQLIKNKENLENGTQVLNQNTRL